VADINVVPTDNNAALIELIKGQASAATELRLQNARLFGGDGQPGAIRLIMDQHHNLEKKLEDKTNELLDKIEANKQELALKTEKVAETLAEKLEIKTTETDKKFSILQKDHTELDKKVTGWSYVLSVASFLLTAALAVIGIKVKAGH
jgi:hypothetical protein